MDDRCRVDSMEENPALLYAALMYLMVIRRKKPIHVVFSYSNRLLGLADWYRQLLAESLGKRHDEEGKEVHAGATPVKALGVTDQHSQVQLYVEGPNDKVFTFFKVEDHGVNLVVPAGQGDHEAMDYLAHHPFAEIMEAERVGTELALKQAERPSCTLVFPRVSPETVGQYFMLKALAVTVMGRYFKVNPFDQPGVEAGKVAAFALLGRPGFEEKRAEIVAGLEKDLSLRA
jgi:glucose-6-phosphate isomerase